MQQNDIESELSYAYLHAVASQAGMECQLAQRLSDNAGINARVHALGDDYGGALTDITLEVQLKATIQELPERDGRFSYSSLDVSLYDKLRSPRCEVQRLLVVLRLPPDAADWLSQTHAELALRRCAYWVSLRNAPASPTQSTHTVYVPYAQQLTPDSLRDLVQRRSHEEWITHEP